MRVDPNGKMVWSTAGTRIVGLNIQTKQFIAYDIPTWVEDQAVPGRLRHRCRDAMAGFGLPSGKPTKSAGWTRLRDKIDEFPTPGVDVPRRMGADWEGNVWVGFHETGKLVKIDQKYGTMTYYAASDREQRRVSRGCRSRSTR